MPNRLAERVTHNGQWKDWRTKNQRERKRSRKAIEASCKMTGMDDSSLPTKFVVHSKDEHPRDFRLGLALIVSIVAVLIYVDPSIQEYWHWLGGGLSVALVILETGPVKDEVELTVDIGPLGVQRRTIKRSNNSNRIIHLPFLPRSAIHDCILSEHVGAFSVSTHVVFRIIHCGDDDDHDDEHAEKYSIIPAFPNANLPFAQCQLLVLQMQRALKETE